MGSLDNPKTWVPYMNNQDCSKRTCNLYCPQWCNDIILPSPPPPPATFSDDDSGGGATLSPLVIVIIGVLASAFLLISYYVIISRLCVGSDGAASGSSIANRETLDVEMDEDDYDMEDERLNYAPWHVPSKGLDEDLIHSIRVHKYTRGDGLFSCTDCSVCLGEFREDESLRILPKCSHAFHVYCIDTWLTNHSNCPLCRTNVSCVTATPLLPPPPPPPLPPPETFENDESSVDDDVPLLLPPPPPPPFEMFENHESLNASSEMLTGNHESSSDSRDVSRRVTSDYGDPDAIVEIGEEGGPREIKRSASTSYLCETRVSIADILLVDQEEGLFKPWEPVLEGNSRNSNCVVAMKRSFSSGRYLFTRGWRGSINNGVFPQTDFSVPN